jgi:adenylylsulfate kinase
VKRRKQEAFAVWVTGLPASGKSTIVTALTAQLTSRGVDVAVLESDALRQIFTPNPHYDEDERDTFYRQMVYVGALLTRHGVPVIFDATANRRIYRDRARQQIPKFLEVYVDCPLETCMARDPKGIYRKARESAANTVPGLQATYEPPGEPDLVVHADRETPEAAAKRAFAKLVASGYVETTEEVL